MGYNTREAGKREWREPISVEQVNSRQYDGNDGNGTRETRETSETKSGAELVQRRDMQRERSAYFCFTQANHVR